MERSFRPKGGTVKALPLSPETADYAANWCAGKKDELDGRVVVRVPTLDGPIIGEMDEYLVRTNDGFKVMTAAEFDERFEAVRVTRS